MKRTTTLFATSLDGVSFDKPVLNLVDFNGSKANNILFDGTTAVGIYDDACNDPNASSRSKLLLGFFRLQLGFAGSTLGIEARTQRLLALLALDNALAGLHDEDEAAGMHAGKRHRHMPLLLWRERAVCCRVHGT